MVGEVLRRVGIELDVRRADRGVEATPRAVSRGPQLPTLVIGFGFAL